MNSSVCRRAILLLAAGTAAVLACAALAHGGGADDEKHVAAIDYSKAEETAFGIAADPQQADRTITIGMSDALRFSPAEIAVKQGDAVKFVVKNLGQLQHEMVLGTLDELKAHGELMKRFPGMEHDEPYMAHVAPGKARVIGWRFTKAGEFYFGCLVPGHLDAGMIGKIIVK
jgi:uncharacterized cupredoxin-like copper-binding protein